MAELNEKNLTSPADAVLRQHAMQRAFEGELTAVTQKVIRLAKRSALDGKQPNPAEMSQMWTDEVTRRVENMPIMADKPASAEFALGVLATDYRLVDSIYATTVVVLNEASAEGVLPYARNARLRDALSLDTSDSVLIAAVGEWGMTWRNRIEQMATSVATSVVNWATGIALLLLGLEGKRWVTRRDSKVRPEHAAVDGMTVYAAQKFIVGGFAMDMPGDTAAPMNLTANCRCVAVAVAKLR